MTTATPSRLLNTSEVRRLAAADVFKGIFVVNSLIKKTDKNGRPYWEIVVSDTFGNINAKIWSDAGWWDRSTTELENKPDMLSESQITDLRGRTVGITGRVSDYRGQLQFSFNAISLLNQNKYQPSGYVAHSDVPRHELEEGLDAMIGRCGEPIRSFLERVFSGDRREAFIEAPAAVSNHHAYASGLLEHTLMVTESARSIAAAYRDVYQSMDMDIVTAGALLHDLGKIESYAMSPMPEMTLAGAVLDHIALGYAACDRLAEEAGLPEAVRRHIGHIMLSHHGQKEFGSPVLPATPEALVVSAADELDFRLFCWKDATRDLAANQNISAYHFAAQRRFWKVSPNREDSGEG
ncbi:MAG: HD domain-containing protein [Synergistaceae bacterium]|jgi:3'-5' exoribonuclease|nr:HD domain-containing protein [Synergistaceae bacterium]